MSTGGASTDATSSSWPPEKTDVFDASQYTIAELASALDYELEAGEEEGRTKAPPDVRTLQRDRRAYKRRLEVLEDDDEEERRHKERARAFFDAAYDIITAYLYPKYGGLRSATQRILSSTSAEGEKGEAARGGGDEDGDSMAPPGMRTAKAEDGGFGALTVKPRAVSSQMIAEPVTAAALSSDVLTGTVPWEERKRTRTTIVNVDTRFRKNYFDKSRGDVTSSSEIYFSLDERIKNVRKMSIASLEYPNSAWAISSALKSNIFYIQVCENGYQTRENAQSNSLAISASLPPAGTQHYIDHAGTHHAVANTGALGTYRISMMSGNYNKDTLVASINHALRTTDVSSGLAAVMVEFNTAFNKMIMRVVDPSSDDVTEAASIYYPGVNITKDGRTYRGNNVTGGLVTKDPKTFKYNLYFDLFEELDASGNYDLTKPLLNRPLFFNAGWVMGFRKERYIYDDDYIRNLEKQTATGFVGAPTTETSYFLGYNAESPRRQLDALLLRVHHRLRDVGQQQLHPGRAQREQPRADDVRDAERRDRAHRQQRAQAALHLLRPGRLHQQDARLRGARHAAELQDPDDRRVRPRARPQQDGLEHGDRVRLGDRLSQ